MPKPETTVEDPQEEGIKTWVGKFISEEHFAGGSGRPECSKRLSFSESIAAEQAFQLSRIADALESLDSAEHQKFMTELYSLSK